jgi:signal transduction histidine kinase
MIRALPVVGASSSATGERGSSWRQGMPFFNSVLARRTFGYLLAGTLALLAIVAASIWLAARTINHADEIARARSVRTLASTVLGALLDAETGQRGFLLTHADRYLEPYEQARQRLPTDLSSLRALAANEPRGTAILDRLGAVSNQKLAELAETIRLEQGGEHAAALALVNDDLGRRLMDEARGLLAEFIDQAETRVNDRLKQLDDAVTLLMWTTIAGSILILVFTGAAAYTVMSYTRELIAAQQEVVALNATLEDRVRERTAALSQANEEIQRFAYIVSHDLRSPLVNIMGFTSELETGIANLQKYLASEQPDAAQVKEARVAADDDIPEAVRFIRASTAKMDGLINAILKLSREGRRTLQPEPVDLARLSAQAAASLKHQIDEAGAAIELPATAPLLITDRLALEQVIGNLLDNAVKYLAPNRPGRIVVAAEQVAGRVRVTVSDNGRGIAPQDHERIFELFRRAGRQDQPGEGIGLAHVRALVRRLGGDITVSSELGRGSAFQIDLPARLRPSDNL